MAFGFPLMFARENGMLYRPGDMVEAYELATDLVDFVYDFLGRPDLSQRVLHMMPLDVCDELTMMLTGQRMQDMHSGGPRPPPPRRPNPPERGMRRYQRPEGNSGRDRPDGGRRGGPHGHGGRDRPPGGRGGRDEFGAMGAHDPYDNMGEQHMPPGRGGQDRGRGGGRRGGFSDDEYGLGRDPDV